MLVAAVLLVVAVVAVPLWWGTWGVVAVAAAVAIVEYAALRRTERRHTARASLARLRPSACRRAW